MPKKVVKTRLNKKCSKWFFYGLWTLVVLLIVSNFGLLLFANGESLDGDPADKLRTAAEKDRQSFEKLSFWQRLLGGQILKDENDEGKKSQYDGLPIDLQYDESIVSVMIDNIASARPQHSGISQASLVYEALVEGGITRLMLVFPYQEIDRVGPVRSARDYFVGIAEEYGGVYTHAGGSPIALEQLWFSDKVLDMDEDIRIGGDTYSYRDTRYTAPHNLYFDLLLLREYLTELDLNSPLASKTWCFNDELPPETQSVQEIALDFSNDVTSNYYVLFRYDEETATYKRFYGKYYPKPHTDQADGLQVSPRNIVVQIVPSYLIDGDEKERIGLNYIGSGQAFYYFQGQKIVGSWSKKSAETVTRFVDEKNNPLCLNPGQTWVALLDSEDLLQEN